MFTIQFNNLGFADCSTNQNCGAFYIYGRLINLSHICGNMCEAINYDNQFFSTKSDISTVENTISYLTVSFCGMQNRGNTAYTITGASNYVLQNINSSYNFNKYGHYSYGACFCTKDVKTYRVDYFNFICSTGLDVINTNLEPTGYIRYGNVHNCSTDYIVKYRGTNTMQSVYFGKLTFSQSFICGATKIDGHTLIISSSYFDIKPSDYDSGVTLDASNNEDISLTTTNIAGLENLDNCQIPSIQFTLSEEFTMSFVFSPSSYFSNSKSFTASLKFSESKPFSMSKSFEPSSQFSRSNYFSPSGEFTASKSFSASSIFSKSKQFSQSNSFSSTSSFTSKLFFSASSKFTSSGHFSPSLKIKQSSAFTPSSLFSSSSHFSPSSQFSPSLTFTRSNLFSPSLIIIVISQTATFTPSNVFTPSFTFSPNATKYPDGLGGYDKAQVSGHNKLSGEKAAAAVGATAGISAVIIGVSVALMLLYMRSKQRQLHQKPDELSDSFLHDSSDSSSSMYSYSYYTYEYVYSYEEEDYESYEDEESSSLSCYSDFKMSYLSSVENAK